MQSAPVQTVPQVMPPTRQAAQAMPAAPSPAARLRSLGTLVGNVAVQNLLQGGVRKAMTDSTPGSPLDPKLRADLAQQFGRPLDNVRIHTDPGAGRLAASLDARAF